MQQHVCLLDSNLCCWTYCSIFFLSWCSSFSEQKGKNQPLEESTILLCAGLVGCVRASFCSNTSICHKFKDHAGLAQLLLKVLPFCGWLSAWHSIISFASLTVGVAAVTVFSIWPCWPTDKGIPPLAGVGKGMKKVFCNESWSPEPKNNDWCQQTPEHRNSILLLDTLKSSGI